MPEGNNFSNAIFWEFYWRREQMVSQLPSFYIKSQILEIYT
jgi:hypothetical protein